MIARHSGECKPHAYQDAKYGNRVRVMNPVTDKGNITGGRCTVCCPPKESGKKRGGVYDLSQLQIIRR